MGLPEVSLGIIPGYGGSQRQATRRGRRVRFQRQRRLCGRQRRRGQRTQRCNSGGRGGGSVFGSALGVANAGREKVGAGTTLSRHCGSGVSPLIFVHLHHWYRRHVLGSRLGLQRRRRWRSFARRKEVVVVVGRSAH